MLDLLGSDCFAAVHAVLALGFGLRVLLAFPALPPANDRPHQSLVAAALTPAVLLAVVNSPTASAAALTAGLHVLRFPRQSRVLVPAAAAASACAALASLGTGSVSPLSAGLLVSFAVAAVACAGVLEAGAWYRRRGYSPVLPTTSGDRGEGGGPAPIVSRPVPPAMQNCSLLSLLYFHWMQPLVSKGRGRSLEMEDIPPLSTRLQSENVSTQFWQHWDAELLLNRADSRRPAAPVSPLEIDSPGRPAKVRRRPSLWRALGRTFGLRLALGGLLKAGNDVCVFLSPLLLQQIILHLQHASANPGDASNIPRGLGLAAALFIVTCAQSIFFNQYFGVMVVIQSQVAASLISTTFDKTCKLSSSALVAFSRGFVQNLMAVDARILADSVLYLNTLWSGILQVAVSLALLKRLLGWAATLAGVGLIVCCVPVQVLLIRVMKRTRELASACTDERVKIVGEALSSVGVVRYMAWERAFIGRILDARLAELRLVRLALYVQAVNSSMTTSIPIVLALIALSTYVLVGGKLDASVIFPAIALFQVLRPQMSLIPSVIISVTRSVAAASRISRFLLADDLPSRDQGDHAVPADEFERSDCDVIAKSASVAWDVGFGVTLGNISMELPRGSLTCIVGAVASGKTTCLAGLLGELPVVSGHIGVRPGRSISYCEQEPFIQNATLRENVLFGLPMDEVRYRRALRLSCLLADLKVLPAGDLTEIGGKGVNLSGGQKARASLARALYSNSDIVLLDAPLAAVDAHVGRFIWEKCIVGGMERRTRVLTTNHLQFAASSHVDCVAVLEHGVLVEFGRRADLMADPSSAFSILVASQRTPAPATASPAAEGAAEVGGGDGGGGGGVGDEGASVLPKGHDGDDEAEDGIMLGTAGGSGNTAGTAPARLDAAASSERGRLVQVEGKSSGRVALRHYVKYMQATGGVGALALTVALFASSQAASLGTNVFLSVWSEESRLGGYADGRGTRGKLLAYAGISVLAAALPAMSNVAVTGMSIRASVLLHERLCTTVFASPSAWFDTTPVGRILNRFNASVDKVDNSLAFTLQSVVRISMNLISSFALIFYATPAFVFVAVPIGMCYLLVQSYYRNSAVDLRRLESVSRSPLYSHFGETLDGVITLRAYGAVPRIRRENFLLTNRHLATSFASAGAARWLSCRLEFLAAILTFSSAALAALMYKRVSAELSGLTLSYSMQIVLSLSWSVRQATEAESQMSAIEQLAEYSDAPPHPQEESQPEEADDEERENSRGLVTKGFLRHIARGRSHHARPWPSRGRIRFSDVWMRYRPELPPVLRGVTFDVEPGWKVGILGRTGSGKSTTVSALFRITELERGRITIDGKDIASLRLDALRSSLGMIAQSPTLFSGTIRSNLDMAGVHSDAAVAAALSVSGLRDTASHGDVFTLDTVVTEGGASLSLGQRQLLCLGRVLLRGSKVCVLDEATSAVDAETDSRMGATIAEHLADHTVLIVAHRLGTVMHCDRICVMDNGTVAEYDTPLALLARPDSLLSALVAETGPETAAHLRALAAGRPSPPSPPRCTAARPSARERARAAYGELRAALATEDGGGEARRMVAALAALAEGGDAVGGRGGGDGSSETAWLAEGFEAPSGGQRGSDGGGARWADDG